MCSVSTSDYYLDTTRHIFNFNRPNNTVDNVSKSRITRHIDFDAISLAGGADPERMAPPRVEEYLAELFCGTNVTMQVVSDQETLLQEYPLFACVNRAASMIPRHAGRIIFLTYEPPNPACILETVMLVGKGVTYDTGGTDLKVEGTMFGMSRDKCGAAACAGFMQVRRDSTIRINLAPISIASETFDNAREKKPFLYPFVSLRRNFFFFFPSQ